eukprot:1195597-Prorocentrum_minimum.AAC.3
MLSPRPLSCTASSAGQSPPSPSTGWCGFLSPSRMSWLRWTPPGHCATPPGHLVKHMKVPACEAARRSELVGTPRERERGAKKLERGAGAAAARVARRAPA